jgi:hypothetical protein
MMFKNAKSSIFCIFLVLFLTGCSDKQLETPGIKACQDGEAERRGCDISPESAEKPTAFTLNLYDKLSLSQNPLDYVTDHNQTNKYDFLDANHVRTKLFMVWDSDFKASVSESLWVLDIIKKQGFKENLQPYSSEEKAKLTSDLYSAKSVNFLGIISRNTDIRAFPTKKPYFYDSKIAGEGYPFDNFQCSRIYVNTPVRIVALSSDGAFYYVATPLTDGWIDSRDALVLSKGESDFLRSSDIFVNVVDKIPLADANGKFVEKMSVGSFVYSNEDAFYSVNGNKIVKVDVDKKSFIKFPLRFSQLAIASLAKEIMRDPYGWGGALDDRDCSMYLRDLFLPFGLYLPRNSYGQATKGNIYIDLSNMSESKKIDFIKQRAVPFATFLYIKGHILLYLGVVDGEIVVLHDAWGFAYEENKTEKRFILGRPIISTLYVGSKHENFMRKKSLAARLQGIRVLE